MPSEDRAPAVLQALAPARDAFHGAVVAAVEELRGYIAANRPTENVARAAAASLGEFAQGRIDAERFGALFAHEGRLSPEELGRLEQALDMLRGFAQQGDELHRVTVAAGADLRDSVRSALAARGRVFAAARGAELIRNGRGQQPLADEHGGFPFRLWNRAERQIAPPLVVEVAGGDLQVAGLAEYLDGRFKLVLLVQEPAPVAPLARLIAPHVFVQQTTTVASLERLVSFDGPAVAALVPAGCAGFTWDPHAGARFEQRLRVEEIPADEQQPHQIGSVGVAQQQADVQWLRELVAVPSGLAGLLAGDREQPVARAAGGQVDVLAAWLLRQTNLDGI
jgi:hypothetical protein